MSYKVILSRGNHSEVYGTYSTETEANAVAGTHNGLGYWEATVVAVRAMKG